MAPNYPFPDKTICENWLNKDGRWRYDLKVEGTSVRE